MLPAFLTGCWDKVEIESRGFIISMGIDKYKDDGENDKENGDKKDGESDKENSAAQTDSKAGGQAPRYTVTIALPDVGALMGTGQSEDVEFVRTASAPTVSEAIRQMGSFSGERLYFGHTKAVIFGEELLKDEELFREALDALERNRELSRNLLVLATADDVEKALITKGPGENLAGMYLSKFYKNSDGAAVTFPLGLEALVRELRSGRRGLPVAGAAGETIIPLLSVEGEKKDAKVRLGGAAVIKDFTLAGKLDDSQTRALMWFRGTAEDALLTVEYNEVSIPVRVNSNRARTSFYEENGRIVCVLDIKGKAEVEEFVFAGVGLNNDETLRELNETGGSVIADEILRLFTVFRDELEVDGFGLRERLRKQNHLLYAAYGDDAYDAMTLVVRVDLEVNGAGMIK